jgi:hypothetical protein
MECGELVVMPTVQHLPLDEARRGLQPRPGKEQDVQDGMASRPMLVGMRTCPPRPMLLREDGHQINVRAAVSLPSRCC